MLQESGGKSEELATLAPEAVAALRGAGLFQLKLPAVMGGAEADPVTEMLVLERIAYYDFTSAWCTMVGATGVASLGMFLPQAWLDQVFANGQFPTASISFFPGRPRRARTGRLPAQRSLAFQQRHPALRMGCRRHRGRGHRSGEWRAPAGDVFSDAAKDVTLYDNWRDVVGLKGTGSCDCSIENYFLPADFAFVWDLLKPQPRRGGASYLLPPYSFVAKEHGSVAVGAARRALDELITLATTTRGRVPRLETR